MTHHHDEFLLPTSDQARAIRRAYDALPDHERAKISAQAYQIMQELAGRRRTPAGLGIGGALELLAKLGVWINDNPQFSHEIAARFDPDDLIPETNR